MTTRSSSRELPSVVTRAFSPKAPRPEEWLAFMSTCAFVLGKKPGDPIIDDEMRQRDMQIDWPLLRRTASSHSLTMRSSDRSLRGDPALPTTRLTRT
jgi:hypothetical protein